MSKIIGEDAASKNIDALANVIRQLEQSFSADEVINILDECACCKGGKRNKDCRKFAKDNKGKSLSEKIALLPNVQWMGNPILNDDGTITTGIYWKVDNAYKCPCWALKGKLPSEPMPLSYCACCAGHFRYHYQNALGVKLVIKEIVSSAVNSIGEKPCEFIFEIAEE